MEIAHWNNGTAGRTEVDASFLGDKVMSRTLHAAAVMYQANQRAGTHKTKTRGEINRSKRSPLLACCIGDTGSKQNRQAHELKNTKKNQLHFSNRDQLQL